MLLLLCMHIDIANHDWVGWAIGLIAVILAVFFYVKSRVVHRLAYQFEGRHLVGGEKAVLPDEVAVSYRGSIVPRLSASDLVIWNAGNQTLRGTDIVEKDPVRVIFSPESRILRAQVATATRAVNMFAIRLNPEHPNEALCEFDYLDPGDGVRLEILHTDEERYPTVKGTIRGLPEGMSNWGKARPIWSDRYENPRANSSIFALTKYAPYTMAALGALATLVGTILWIRHRHNPQAKTLAIDANFDEIFFGTTGALYMLTGLFLIWTRRRRFPKSLANS